MQANSIEPDHTSLYGTVSFAFLLFAVKTSKTQLQIRKQRTKDLISSENINAVMYDYFDTSCDFCCVLIIFAKDLDKMSVLIWIKTV